MVEELKLENLVTSKNIIMDMKNADYLLFEGGIDWGNVKVTHNTGNNVSLIGQYLINSVIESRDIAISGWIIGKTEQDIFNKKDVLSKMFNPLETVKISTKKYSIIGTPSSNVIFSKTYEENNDKMCKFLLQIFCAFPYFEDNEKNSVAMVDITPMFRFPLIIPEEGFIFSKSKDSRFQTAFNNGATSTGFKLIFEANGTVNNPTLISITTQEFIRINKILHQGEIVEVSTDEDRYVYGFLNGIKESYLDYFDYDNSWMQLKVGSNILTIKTYDDEGNEDETYRNMSVSIIYNQNYLNLPEE